MEIRAGRNTHVKDLINDKMNFKPLLTHEHYKNKSKQHEKNDSEK